MLIRKYMHVPEPGIISYSAIPSGHTTRMNCPAFGNGVYVFVGSGGMIRTGATPETAAVVTSGTTQDLNFVLWDSFTAAFWAVGNNGTMLKSVNGVSWSAVSLPGTVAADGLTGISTNGAGIFVVSNGSAGYRALQSLDGGATWATHAMGSTDGAGSFMSFFDGNAFFLGRNSFDGTRVLTYSSNVPGGAWVEVRIPGGGDIVMSMVRTATHRVIAGNNGFIATCPMSSLPSAGNWTVRASGVTSSLRLFTASGCVEAVGSSGVSLESADNGATWNPGQSTGVSSFVRYGMHDPMSTRRALIVGDGGVIRAGEYGFRVKGYASETDRVNNTPNAQSRKVTYAEQASSSVTVPVDLI